MPVPDMRTMRMLETTSQFIMVGTTPFPILNAFTKYAGTVPSQCFTILSGSSTQWCRRPG